MKSGAQVLSNADGDGHDGADGEPPPEQLWPASQLQEAAAAALSAGACKAKSMADAEERDIQRTVAEVDLCTTLSSATAK